MYPVLMEASYMSANTHFMHSLVMDVASYCMYLLELLSCIIIVFTTVMAFVQLFRRNNYARVYLLHGLSISLSFKLGAEILRTITAASLADIVEVFLLIVIKGCIMFLIEKELSAISEEGVEAEDILHVHHHVHSSHSHGHAQADSAHHSHHVLSFLHRNKAEGNPVYTETVKKSKSSKKKNPGVHGLFPPEENSDSCEQTTQDLKKEIEDLKAQLAAAQARLEESQEN